MPDVPEAYRQWTMDDYGQQARVSLAPFLSGYRWSAFLCGGYGTKKTSLAAAVLRRWRASGKPSNQGAAYGEFVTPEGFAEAARDFENGKARLKAWERAEILVLDDIGAYRNTPHLVETVLLMLSARYNRVRPTIVTCNLRLEELGRQLDGRIASRFADGVCLDLGDKDVRGAK